MVDLDILKELPIQNLDIQEGSKEEEKTLEVMDSLVLPSEVADVTLMTVKMEWENTKDEKEVEELTDQELASQKEEEEYSIYVAGISEEEESDTETDSEESPCFF